MEWPRGHNLWNKCTNIAKASCLLRSADVLIPLFNNSMHIFLQNSLNKTIARIIGANSRTPTRYLAAEASISLRRSYQCFYDHRRLSKMGRSLSNSIARRSSRRLNGSCLLGRVAFIFPLTPKGDCHGNEEKSQKETSQKEVVVFS